MRLRALLLMLLLPACGAIDSHEARDDRALRLRLADATLGAGAADTALGVSDSLLQQDPHDVQALLRRGRALLALHRPGDAARSFAEAAQLAPGDVAGHAGLARARADEGDAPGAEAAWRAALVVRSADPAAKAGLAVALDLQERHAEAQVLYRALLARQPDDNAVRSDLGLSLALSGHAAEALPLLREAAAGAPGGSEARVRNNLAVGLALAGDEAGARALLQPDLGTARTTDALTGVRLLATR